ncbi:MAG TPA: cytochrome ubiquinol oxidase subunit I [Pirellulales bacterium]|nr:cytochrome ubiquinol oxidase subunit I [Pirellulales bacterium]
MADVVLVVLLAVHLLLVDIAMAGPLICVWLEWRESRHADEAAGQVGLRLARFSNAALAIGIVIGGLLLAMRWWLDDRTYFSAVAAIPRDRLWFALGELLFYFGCMAAYIALWQRWRRRRLAHRVLAIAAASNLLVHFPALFAIISALTERADLLGASLDRSGYQRLLLDPEVLSRVVHVWLAAFAVAGVALMGLGLRIDRSPEHNLSRNRLIKAGALVALVATLLQIPSGLWVAMEMPEAARDPLFGGDWMATGLFVTSFLLALQLMHSLAGIALGNREPRQIRNSVAVIMLVLLLMVGTRGRTQDCMVSTHHKQPVARPEGHARASHDFVLHPTQLGLQ